jgi:hypothetical protein
MGRPLAAGPTKALQQRQEANHEPRVEIYEFSLDTQACMKQ